MRGRNHKNTRLTGILYRDNLASRLIACWHGAGPYVMRGCQVLKLAHRFASNFKTGQKHHIKG